MAEAAVGFLGTATGLVSLGMQVYKELKEYIDGYKTRNERVRKTLSRLELLRQSLESLDSTIPSFRDQHRKPAEAVMLSLQTAWAQLQVLADKLKENEPSNPIDMRGKLKEMKNKLVFPFRNSDLEKLESTLGSIVGYLSIAMQGLELAALSTVVIGTANIDNTITTISPQLDAINANVHTIRADVARQADAYSGISTELQSIWCSTSRIEDRVRGMNPSMQSLHSEMLMLRQAVELLQNSSSSSKTLGDTFVGKMVQKQSFLRETCDAVNQITATLHDSTEGDPRDNTQQGSSEVTEKSRQASRLCSCRRRRQITRKSSPWFLFQYYDEKITESKHEPGCFLFQPTTLVYKRKFGILITGLRWYLSTAIFLGLCTTHGAGGSSISSTIQYYAMVKSYASPAFRIAYLLAQVLVDKHGNHTWAEALAKSIERYSGLEISGLSSSNISSYQDIIRIGISNLRQTFENGLFLPTDVDEEGGTIMHQVARYVHWFGVHSGFEDDMTGLYGAYDLFQALLDLGVPCTTPAEPATSSIIDILLSEDNFGLSPTEKEFVSKHIMTNLIIRQAPEITGKTFDIVEFRDSVAELEPLAGAFGFDSPIYMAILRRNEDDLRRILKGRRTGSSIQDDDSPALTHLAIAWPKGLKILLKGIPTLDINSKYKMESPLALAMRQSASICVNYIEDICENCGCIEPIKMLLEARCHLPYSEVENLSLVDMSQKAIITFFDHIKTWRDKLKSLFFNHFPEMKFTERYNSPVLDSKAGEVVEKLERKGVFPYQEFNLQPDDYRLGGPRSATGSCTVYHSIECLDFALTALELGFQDFDTYFNGCTPLTKQMQKQWYNIDYSAWLVAHGATFAHQIPYPLARRRTVTMDTDVLPNLPILRMILTKIINEIRCDGLLPVYYEAFPLLMNSSINDGCICGCSKSSDGCYPLTMFLNSYLGQDNLNPFEDRPAIVLGDLLDDLVEETGSNIHIEAILRAFTFNFLTFKRTRYTGPTELRGLKHTCCVTLSLDPSLDDLKCYGEDREEIREEEHVLLCKLDELVDDFVQQFSGGAYSLSKFLKAYWLPRMKEVQDELELGSYHLTEQERWAIESIGVKLEDDSDSTSEWCSASSGRNSPEPQDST